MKRYGVLAIALALGSSTAAFAQAEDEVKGDVKSDAQKEAAPKDAPPADDAKAKPQQQPAADADAQSEAQPEKQQAPAADETAAPAPEKSAEQAPAADDSSKSEQKALEHDMAKAHEAVEAQKGEGAPAAAGFEEIKAAPVTDGAGAAAASGTGVATVAEELAEVKSGFSATVVLDHSLGTGTFLANDALRSSDSYVAQSWDIRPSYAFTEWGHKLKATARFVFELEYTTPNETEGRRFKPADTRLYLSDAEVYKEPLSGVVFNAGVNWSLPTSWESINVRKQWSAFTGNVGAKRSIGPVDLSYSFGVTKYLNSSKVKVARGQVAREGEAEILSSVSDPIQIQAGAANNNWLLNNSFDVSYNVTETLAVTYSLAILNYFKYTIAADRDQYTSINADPGVGRADMLWPTLDATYALSSALGDKLDLPVKLYLSAGITALHPAQSDNNETIIWPVFVQALASNRAADNYGSFYFDITGTY